MNFKFIISDIICINDAYWGFFCLSSFFNFTIKMINAYQRSRIIVSRCSRYGIIVKGWNKFCLKVKKIKNKGGKYHRYKNFSPFYIDLSQYLK